MDNFNGWSKRKGVFVKHVLESSKPALPPGGKTVHLFYTNCGNTLGYLPTLLYNKQPPPSTSCLLFCPFSFLTGQQRSSGLLPQWILHFSLLYSWCWPASGPTSILWKPAATSLVLASKREIKNTRRRDHDEADLSAIRGPSQNRYHTCWPRMVSKLMFQIKKLFSAVF